MSSDGLLVSVLLLYELNFSKQYTRPLRGEGEGREGLWAHINILVQDFSYSIFHAEPTTVFRKMVPAVQHAIRPLHCSPNHYFHSDVKPAENFFFVLSKIVIHNSTVSDIER